MTPSLTPSLCPPLRLTGHPLQRAGAWATSLLAGHHKHPGEVNADDLDRAAEQIVNDLLRAAVAPTGGEGYDWWKVLFALYPNSKPTHASRPKDRTALRPEFAALFVPDTGAQTLRPCTFCTAPAGVLWAKSTLPMFDKASAVNTLPPSTVGWPVCRACRIAVWALPYASWLTPGSATVLTCDQPAVERTFAERNFTRNARIRQFGFDSLPATAGPEAVVLRALVQHAADHPDSDPRVGTTLWVFKNDNQEPWLRVSSTRLAVVSFLRRLPANSPAHFGWVCLGRSLTKRDAQGTVTQSGATVLARALFDREFDGEFIRKGMWTDGLSSKLWNVARQIAKQAENPNLRTVRALRELFFLYVKEMYGMDPHRLRPVAQLLADWITAETNSRGRFNEYRAAAGSAYELHKVLVQAAGRLALDGHCPPNIVDVFPEVTGSGNDGSGWRLRGLLFFEVLTMLMERGVRLGKRPDATAEDEDEAHETAFDNPLLEEESA